MKYPQSKLYSTVAEPVGGGDSGASLAGQQDSVFGATPGPDTSAPVQATPPAAAPTPPIATPPVAATVSPVAPTTPPPAQQLTPDQIADLGASAAARVLQAQRTNTPAAPEPRLSQEEFDKTFNVFKVDAATFAAITGYAPEKPEQVTALNTAFQGVARQALTMANALVAQKMEAMKGEIMGQFAPVKASHEAQFQKQLESEFFAAAPDLADFRPLIETVIKSEMQSGRKFASKEELFKFAADKTRSLLPATVLQQPAGAVAPNGTTPNQQPTTQRRMTPASTGGQVSQGQGSAAPRGDAQTIFG